MGIDQKGSQGQTQRAVVLQEEEDSIIIIIIVMAATIVMTIIMINISRNKRHTKESVIFIVHVQLRLRRL
jgi:hypothetical protein